MAKVKELVVICSKCSVKGFFYGITNRDCKKDFKDSEWQKSPLICPTCTRSEVSE